MIRAALALVAVVASSAAADGTTAEEAGDANLEPVGQRQGITIAFAVGGALTLGLGVEDATGRGGAAALRVARVATRRALVTLEGAGSALFHGASMGKTAQNTMTRVEVGLQYYARPRLWIRGAVGYAVYQARQVLIDPMTGDRGDVRLRGAGGTFGIGVELVKWRRFALQLEVFSTAMINRDGVLSSSGLMIGPTFD